MKTWDQFFEAHFDEYFGAIADALFQGSRVDPANALQEAALSSFLRKSQKKARERLRAIYDGLVSKPDPITPAPTRKVGVS